MLPAAGRGSGSVLRSEAGEVHVAWVAAQPIITRAGVERSPLFSPTPGTFGYTHMVSGGVRGSRGTAGSSTGDGGSTAAGGEAGAGGVFGTGGGAGAGVGGAGGAGCAPPPGPAQTALCVTLAPEAITAQAALALDKKGVLIVQ